MEKHRVTAEEFKQRLEEFNAKHLKLFKAVQKEMTMTDKPSQAELELTAYFTREQLRIVAAWLLEERRLWAAAGYNDEPVHTLLSLAQRLEGLAK